MRAGRNPIKNTLLKTGGAAVAVTILFGIAAYRAAEWGKAHEPGLVDRKQPLNSTAASNTDSVTQIIPQVVIGSFDGGLTRYSTTMEIVNVDAAETTIDFSFYKEDGTPSPLALSTNVAGHPSFVGDLSGFKLDPNKVLVISGGTTAQTTPSSGVVGWAKLTSTKRATIATFYETRDGNSGILYSRVGIPASRPDLSNFVIPRVRTRAGLDVAFALVNTGSAPASITATLKDASGSTLAKRALDMNPGTHQALFAHEFFSTLKETDESSYQYITFYSSSRSFAAIALAFEGSSQTSFPVEPLE
jgi:hypothetical protein